MVDNDLRGIDTVINIKTVLLHMQGEILGSLSDIDDLTSTFAKVCFSLALCMFVQFY